MTHMAVSTSDVFVLTKKMCNVIPDMTRYAWRADGDDYMLRISLMDLRQQIDDVLKRSDRVNPHQSGTPT